MAIASGTCGTCKWTIDDDGKLTIGAGTINAPWLTGIMNNNWPWGGHAAEIISCEIASGVIIGNQHTIMGGTTDPPNISHMFYGCVNMKSITFKGTFDTSKVVKMTNVFNDCSSLVTLDLTPFDTAKTTDMSCFFSGCTMLTEITFGPKFDTAALESVYGLSFVGSGFSSALNRDNGIFITSSTDFVALSKEEHAGTWKRSSVSVRYIVSATRTDDGKTDEDGEDVKISIAWLTGAATEERTISIYMKPSAGSAYPAEPDVVKELTGDSGNTDITIENIGDDAYDFKVEFYDGTHTYIAFPSVTSNIRLVTIDPDGIPSCHNKRGDFGTIFELIYPVGSIYMSANDVSPAVMFGGTWEQIEDRFLLSAGSAYAAGSTGGEATHKLTIAEMPSHTHVQNQHRHSMGALWSDGTGSESRYVMQTKRGTQTRYTAYSTPTNQNTGGGGAHNNMPPYLTVYMWKRIA